MALQYSKEIERGAKAPAFELKDTVSGKTVFLEHQKGQKATLLAFICNHCPYVIHTIPEFVAIANSYRPKGINTIAISSNDPQKVPQDHPNRMMEFALQQRFTFPYLFDETQEVARAYGAQCTPDIFLFDKNLQLYYHGRLDGSSPGNGVPLTGEELRRAIDALLADEPAPQKQHPAMGCSIKWK